MKKAQKAFFNPVIEVTQEEILALTPTVVAGKFTYDSNAILSEKLKERAIGLPKLVFTPTAYLKMMSLVQQYNKELAWHGLVDRTVNEAGEIIMTVTDILVYPQLAAATTVDSDDEKYVLWANGLDDETFDRVRLQGHSHVNMACFPSGTDNEYYQKLFSTVSDFYVVIIANKKHEFYVRYYDHAKNLIITDFPIIVGEEDASTWADEQIKEFIKDKVPVGYNHTGYAGSYPGATTHPRLGGTGVAKDTSFRPTIDPKTTQTGTKTGATTGTKTQQTSSGIKDLSDDELLLVNDPEDEYLEKDSFSDVNYLTQREAYDTPESIEDAFLATGVGLLRNHLGDHVLALGTATAIFNTIDDLNSINGSSYQLEAYLTSNETKEMPVTYHKKALVASPSSSLLSSDVLADGFAYIKDIDGLFSIFEVLASYDVAIDEYVVLERKAMSDLSDELYALDVDRGKVDVRSYINNVVWLAQTEYFSENLFLITEVRKKEDLLDILNLKVGGVK